MLSVFLEPFWASMITVDDGGYLIPDDTLHRVMLATDDAIHDIIDSQVVIETVWDEV